MFSLRVHSATIVWTLSVKTISSSGRGFGLSDCDEWDELKHGDERLRQEAAVRLEGIPEGVQLFRADGRRDLETLNRAEKL
jgi:hypothetical protein